MTCAAGVEQRAAGVARVDRSVGLDHLVDREAVRRLDLALEAGHDACRRRAVEPERVADRDRGVADLDVTRVGEGERPHALAALASTWMAARSVEASTPSTRASCSGPSSLNRTCTCEESPTTCALVTIVPSPSTRKPVPEPLPVAPRRRSGWPRRRRRGRGRCPASPLDHRAWWLVAGKERFRRRRRGRSPRSTAAHEHGGDRAAAERREPARPPAPRHRRRRRRGVCAPRRVRAVDRAAVPAVYVRVGVRRSRGGPCSSPDGFWRRR